MDERIDPYLLGKNHPAEIISHAVWLYFRFALSFHDIEDLFAARDIVVTYEAVRQWCLKFGQHFVKDIRRRQQIYTKVRMEKGMLGEAGGKLMK